MQITLNEKQVEYIAKNIYYRGISKTQAHVMGVPNLARGNHEESRELVNYLLGIFDGYDIPLD